MNKVYTIGMKQQLKNDHDLTHRTQFKIGTYQNEVYNYNNPKRMKIAIKIGQNS